MMQNAIGSSFAYHQMLVLVAGNVCLFGRLNKSFPVSFIPRHRHTPAPRT